MESSLQVLGPTASRGDASERDCGARSQDSPPQTPGPSTIGAAASGTLMRCLFRKVTVRDSVSPEHMGRSPDSLQPEHERFQTVPLPRSEPVSRADIATQHCPGRTTNLLHCGRNWLGLLRHSIGRAKGRCWKTSGEALKSPAQRVEKETPKDRFRDRRDYQETHRQGLRQEAAREMPFQREEIARFKVRLNHFARPDHGKMCPGRSRKSILSFLRTR